MFDFKAYFWHSNVYINEKYKFDSNEILTAYLNDRQWQFLFDDDYIYRLKCFKRELTVSPDMDYQFYKNYNSTVYKAMDLIEYLNQIIKNLPPYNKFLGTSITKLDDILNNYGYFFEDGMDNDDYTCSRFNEDTVDEYGIGEKMILEIIPCIFTNFTLLCKVKPHNILRTLTKLNLKISER